MHTCNDMNCHSAKAILSNVGDITSFRCGNQIIRFRTSPYLERYTKVKVWDNGYIVVDARYKDVGEVEEYIDLIPILNNLYIDADKFITPIKTVEVVYDE